MGIIIATSIILLWGGHLYYSLLFLNVDFSSPWLYLHILIQAYLYTGLFITAHDAMHGVVAPGRKRVNYMVGSFASFLFAGINYSRLKENHFKHHNNPGTKDDPDFDVSSQNFFVWWSKFLFRYVTISQILIMAIAYNIMKIGVPEINLWFSWIIPAFLSTFQLFFFGTYLPHKKPHDSGMEPHKARTQKANHLWAMLSCYYFGYHYEHHHAPYVPWWRLYKIKKELYGN